MKFLPPIIMTLFILLLFVVWSVSQDTGFIRKEQNQSDVISEITKDLDLDGKMETIRKIRVPGGIRVEVLSSTGETSEATILDRQDGFFTTTEGKISNLDVVKTKKRGHGLVIKTIAFDSRLTGHLYYFAWDRGTANLRRVTMEPKS